MLLSYKGYGQIHLLLPVTRPGFEKGWNNHYAQLAAPGIVIGLHPTDENSTTGTSGNISIGFTADNFEEALSHLQKLNIAVTTRNEEGGQFIHFKDPDGTELYFIKPKW